MKKVLSLSIIFVLLFSSFGCKRFTKKQFDKVKDRQSARVEFLEYPQIKFMEDGSAFYPYTIDEPYDWDFKKKVLKVRKITFHIPVSEEVLEKHFDQYLKSGEDRSCFEFPIKILTGWVGEAQYVPISRCVESEKIPYDVARGDKVWLLNTFGWRVIVTD